MGKASNVKDGLAVLGVWLAEGENDSNFAQISDNLHHLLFDGKLLFFFYLLKRKSHIFGLQIFWTFTTAIFVSKFIRIFKISCYAKYFQTLINLC